MSISDYYGLDGKPISQREWLAMREKPENRVVERTQVGTWLVSTVWLGLDHGFGYSKKPLIFETKVFDRTLEGLEDSRKTYERVGLKPPSPDGILGPEALQQRYATIEEARQGHEAACIAAANGLLTEREVSAE